MTASKSHVTPLGLRGPPRYLRTTSVSVSLLAHASLVWGLYQAPTPEAPSPLMIVELPQSPLPVEPPQQPEPEQPEPEPEQPKPEAPPPKPKPVTEKRQPPQPQAEAAQDPPSGDEPDLQSAAETPQAAIPLAGVTLSNAGTMAIGGASGARPTIGEKARSGPTSVTPTTAPPVAALSDLSRKPQAPALDQALREHYPPAHRRTGTPGKASVRVLLSAQGRVLQARITTESAPGFGAACRKTLLRSQWSAPIDAQGRAVRTELTYRCIFTIDAR